MNENIVSVNCIETQNIEVYWQDEVVLNLDVELMYVKSGQTEIKEYTDKEILPELKNYKKQAQNAMEKAENSANAAAQSEAEVAKIVSKYGLIRKLPKKQLPRPLKMLPRFLLMHILSNSQPPQRLKVRKMRQKAQNQRQKAQKFLMMSVYYIDLVMK